MGGFSGMLGTAGGQSGTGVKGPQGANIQDVTSSAQVQQAQGGVNNSLASQNALLAALQGQNGIGYQNAGLADQIALQNALGQNNGAGNQAAAFNQTQGLANQLAANNGAGNQAAAMNRQQELNSQLASANGVGAQTGALGQQAALNAQLAAANGVGTQQQAIQGLQGVAGQYANIASGQGPNPAQAMLNQQTGANVANQAALMAGQRGAGANVGLLARQAAQQGAGAQQQAVGQAATMQANQQLAALGQQAAAQQAIGGLGTTQAQMQQTGIGQQAGIGSGLTAQQQSGVAQQAAQAQAQIAAQQAQQGMLASQAANQVQAQQAANLQASNQANQLAGQQIGQTGAVTQANLANTGQLQGALGAQNQANVSSQSSVNAANAGLANTQLQGQQGMVGGLLNAGGAGLKAALGAKGGEVKKMADGGETTVRMPAVTSPTLPAAQVDNSSAFGKFVKGAVYSAQNKSTGDVQVQTPVMGNASLNKGMTNFGNNIISAFNPNAPQITEIGKTAGGAADANDMGKGTAPATMVAAKGGMAEKGGKVVAKTASEKAEEPGNSYANDKVKALLSEGEVVIPRSVMQSEDPVKNSAMFVQKVIAKRRMGK